MPRRHRSSFLGLAKLWLCVVRQAVDSVSEEGVRFYNKFLCLGLCLGNFVFGTKRRVFGFLVALARLALRVILLLRVIAVISEE